MRRRRVALTLIAMLVVVLAVLAVLAHAGSYEAVSRQQVERERGGWWTACRGALFEAWEVCGRVEGRVVWVQRHDPDGDGDRHLVLASRFHVRLVKLDRDYAGDTPGVGSTVRAVGPVLAGASGRPEVDALVLAP